MAKKTFNKNTALFTSKLGLNLRKRPFKCYISIIALYGAEEGCWDDPVKKGVVRRIKEDWNILHTRLTELVTSYV